MSMTKFSYYHQKQDHKENLEMYEGLHGQELLINNCFKMYK